MAEYIGLNYSLLSARQKYGICPNIEPWLDLAHAFARKLPNYIMAEPELWGPKASVVHSLRRRFRWTKNNLKIEKEGFMYKFAVLTYVNAVPLVRFLPDMCPNAELIYGTPRETFSELIGGRVDAAIVPVVDYLNTPGLDMADGLGICADGNVESVLLQCKRPLGEVRTINLDPASRTSNLLLAMLLRKHFCVRENISLTVGAADADACVMIGDRALSAEPVLESYDLAGEWKSMTGLPFVFAVWAYRADHPDRRKLSEIVHIAKDTGCDAIAELAKLHAGRLGLTEVRCFHYLTSCIYYDIGPAERNSMQLFRKLSASLMETPRHTIKIKEEHAQT